MNNKWTYGQYSIYRIIFGIYLIIHFFRLLPWSTELFSNLGMLPSGSLSPLFYLFPSILVLNDSPLAVHILLSIGILSSFGLMIGKMDRYAAIGCWYVLTCLFDRNPLIANPSLPYVGWLLLAHACLPTYIKHKQNWNIPEGIFLAAWLAMAIGYSYSGYVKLISPSWIDGTAFKHVLENPLANSTFITEFLLSLPDIAIKLLTWGTLFMEIFFAPLSLFSRIRPWIWLILLGMHIGLLFIIRFPDLTFGMIILHLFTFNPGWIKPKQTIQPLKVFYDGSCGLCHHFIRFTLSENLHRTPFLFMPLQGKSFHEIMQINRVSDLPDSIVVFDTDKEMLYYKTEAVIPVLESLGGLWKLFASLLKFIPLKLSNLIYDLIARKRHKIFKKPTGACPLLAKEWMQFILTD